MKIKKIRLKNFRGYKDFEIEFSSSLNVIIGKNDIGKSTILEALDIFFNSDKIKMEIDDLCVYRSSDKVEIAVSFEVDLDKEYTIETVPTSLKKEFLLNRSGLLEVVKQWDFSSGKLTASSLKTYLNANYPQVYMEAPLISLKNSDLKKKFEDFEEKVNQQGIEARKTANTEMRLAIYAVSQISDFEEIYISIDKEDGRNIGNNISNDFPLYFLFQADRANKDTDKEVQEPLKAITKTAIQEVVDKLEDVKKLIEEKAQEIGKETIHKLAEMNPELASVLRPDMTTKAWDSLFSFSFLGDDNIPMNKRGSGVRRMILLSYFRAEAERKNAQNKNVIYAIEEPETSQHPNHQELLISALKEIATKETHTVIMTTHSPEVAKKCKEENLVLIDANGKNKFLVEDKFKLKSIAKTLGVSPYLSKLVICVEGVNDRNFLYNINQNIPELKQIIDIREENINIIPMEGRNLEDWIKRDYLEGSNVRQFHLYDKDGDEKYKNSINQVNIKNNGSFGILTQMSAMENYIHPDLYEDQFGIALTHLLKDWKERNIPDLIIEEQNIDTKSWDMKRRKAERNVIKTIANGKLSTKMTKALFEDMGIYSEVEGWFLEIKRMYEI
ncbi:ATP-binding protein [Dysgonomonas massiliensis]|uniref:ATP-binding protein n=1 Tax=Dysgonomonas massiliensis TaxID=2040292 RepID=UPI000C770058|nr:ATP-binding protein [Dysgonomonas massiliensis]